MIGYRYWEEDQCLWSDTRWKRINAVIRYKEQSLRRRSDKGNRVHACDKSLEQSLWLYPQTLQSESTYVLRHWERVYVRNKPMVIESLSVLNHLEVLEQSLWLYCVQTQQAEWSDTGNSLAYDMPLGKESTYSIIVIISPGNAIRVFVCDQTQEQSLCLW